MESALKKKCRKQLEKWGWFVLHVIQSNKNGIVDTLIFRGDEVVCIEFKDEGKTARRLQRYRHKELRKAGRQVFVIDNFSDISIFQHQNQNKMGLGINTGATYLSIGDGKITRRVKEPTTKSRARELKNGNTVHEEIYDFVEGFITDIKVQDHRDYGRFWNIHMVDDLGDLYILQMNYSGGYSSAFLKILPNVDFKERVKISPTMKVEGTKKRVSLFINQDGHPLKHFYTKDNPNGLPQMKQIKVKGVLQWDDTEMMEFLENMVSAEILPKIGQSGVFKKEPGRVSGPAPAYAGATEEKEDEPIDDLPF